MVHAEQLDLRIVSFRALEAIAETPQGLAQLKAILNGHLIVPGVELAAFGPMEPRGDAVGARRSGG